MRRVRIILMLAVTIAGATAWYWFRPERAFVDVRVSEAAPDGAVDTLAAGEFSPLAHKGKGTARVIRLADGRRVLRLSSFATLNGPDVRVYLLGALDVRGDQRLRAAGYVDLGPLKGNVGDQNYDIPAEVDLVRYPAPAVWCRRFGVNFTQAVLEHPSQ